MERHQLKLANCLPADLRSCDELWVAVALASDAGFQLVQEHIDPDAKQHWVVGVDLATSPSVLRRFMEEDGSRIAGRYNYKQGRTFHPKVYVIRTGEKYVGYVGSGNCTHGGFDSNVEIALRTEDHTACASLVEQIESWFSEGTKISEQFLADYTAEFAKREKRKKEDEKGVDAFHAAHAPFLAALVEVNDQSVIWLKPIGTTEDPVDDTWSFGQPIQELHFSKKKPVGVKRGHLMITYGIGPNKVLSVFEVISAPVEATPQEKIATPWRERFPWMLQGKNLTPELGREWVRLGLDKGTLKDEYLQLYPEGKITNAGGTGYGTLSKGNDKVRLTNGFGRFIISRIMNTSGTP